MAEAMTLGDAARLPAWVRAYVGLPWADKGRDRRGLDCWGLARLVLAEQYGIALAAWDDTYGSAADPTQTAPVIAQGLALADPWMAVPAGTERAGDGVLLRLAGSPVHLGLVVAPGWMLHAAPGHGVCLERYHGRRWRHRVEGFYRHRGLERQPQPQQQAGNYVPRTPL